jgi:hypothetical protein
MARTHFSHAKAACAKELYPYIKEKYGVSRNRPASYRDGRVYAGGELLGENFGEIDKKLTELYFSELPTSVRFERHAKCISRIIADMPKKISYSRLGEIYIPKRKIKLKDRIIHNRFIYRLGMILFKKGSKIRAFLKKHL